MVMLLKIIMAQEKLVKTKTFYCNKKIKSIFLYLDGIVALMKSKAGPAYRVLNTLADYEKFLENNDHSIIGKINFEKKETST